MAKTKIKQTKKLLVLVLLDGFGIGPLSEGNVFIKAETPFLDKMASDYPIGVLEGIKAKNKTAAELRQSAYLTIGAGRKIDFFIGGQTPELPLNTFPQVVGQFGLKQLYLAETEKYVYLTEFLTGRLENGNFKISGLKYILVPSLPWDGKTISPFMASEEINRKAEEALDKEYDLIVISYANLEAAVLSGDFNLAIKAAEVLDQILIKIVEAALKYKGIIILTSAYGGAEKMVDVQTGKVNQRIAGAPVPLMIVGEEFAGRSLGWPEATSKDLSTVPPIGNLTDIAPTILKIMGLPKPKTMAGRSLV